MRTITCGICGKTVEVAERARNTKYCPDCRKYANELNERRRAAARRAKKLAAGELDDLDPRDSPENIARCLNCPFPDDCHSERIGCPVCGISVL